MIQELLKSIELEINILEEGSHRLQYIKGFKVKKYQKIYYIQVLYNDLVIINRQVTTDRSIPYDEVHYDVVEHLVLKELVMYGIFGQKNLILTSQEQQDIKKNG